MSEFDVVIFNLAGNVENNPLVYGTLDHEDGPFTFWVVKGDVYYASFNSRSFALVALDFFEKNEHLYQDPESILVYLVFSSDAKRAGGLTTDANEAIVLTQLAAAFMQKFQQFIPVDLERVPEKFQVVLNKNSQVESQPAVEAEPEKHQVSTPKSKFNSTK